MAYNTLRLPQKVYLSDIEVYACLLYWITETTVLNVIKYGRIKELSETIEITQVRNIHFIVYFIQLISKKYFIISEVFSYPINHTLYLFKASQMTLNAQLNEF